MTRRCKELTNFREIERVSHPQCEPASAAESPLIPLTLTQQSLYFSMKDCCNLGLGLVDAKFQRRSDVHLNLS